MESEESFAAAAGASAEAAEAHILNIVYYHKTADIAHLYWGELTDLYK